MTPPTGIAVPSVADFLRDLGRSRVVEPSRVDRLFAEAPPAGAADRTPWPITSSKSGS